MGDKAEAREKKRERKRKRKEREREVRLAFSSLPFRLLDEDVMLIGLVGGRRVCRWSDGWWI